jgi:hypothetical protein
MVAKYTQHRRLHATSALLDESSDDFAASSSVMSSVDRILPGGLFSIKVA